MKKNRLSTDLGRRWRLPILTVGFALALILLLTVVSHAARSCHSLGSGLQLYNLDDQPAPFTAYFYQPDGDLQHSFEGTIQPGCNAYFEFEPQDVLTGSLRLESDQEVVGVNLHLATAEFDGNDAFEMVPGDITTTVYFAPWLMREYFGTNSRLLVGNLAPGPNTATVEFFAATGQFTTSRVLAIPENGTAFLRLEEVPELGVDFVGAAIVSADQPIWADVVQQRDTQIASYAVPMEGSLELLLPYVPGYEAGTTQPSIVLHNLASTMDANVNVCAIGGGCDDFVLPPLSSLVHNLTSPDPRAYVVSSDQPVAAVATVGGTEGSWAYAGLPPHRATRYQYAPMIFSNYQDIQTTLWLFNAGSLATTAQITFTGTPTPTIWTTSQPIDPEQMAAVAPPAGQAHYAAQIDAGPGGQILALVEGTLPAADGRFAYRTSGYANLAAPICQPTQVPTLTEWGYIILTAAILLIAAWAIRRQLRPAQEPTSA